MIKMQINCANSWVVNSLKKIVLHIMSSSSQQHASTIYIIFVNIYICKLCEFNTKFNNTHYISQSNNLLAVSHLRTCRPPPLKSGGLKKWLWMVRSVLNRTGKIIQKFYDFYFSSYGWKFIENWGYIEYKNDHNSKKSAYP